MAHKTEKFRITGMSYYTDDIMENLATENDDYLLSKRDLIDSYCDGDKIFKYEFENTPLELVPEPDNEYDPNAIKVVVNGTKIGYIKKGSTTHLKNLLESPDFSGKSIEIYGGKYKQVCDDTIETDEMKIRADLEIYTRIEAPAAPIVQTPEEPQKPIKDNSKLIKVEMIGGIVLFVCGLIGKSVLLSVFGIAMSVIAFMGYRKNK